MAGCKTIMIPEFQPLDPPEKLMLPAEKLQEVPTQPDGTAKANDALVTAILNYTGAKKNENTLTSLQDWINETNKKIEDLNKKKKKNK